MAKAVKEPKKEIQKITLELEGKQQVLEFSQILNMVLKAHGLRYCKLCSDLQEQIVNQVKDDTGAVHPAEQVESHN